jgi:predicted DNA-binding protein (UPF0251 family)
MVRPTKCRFVDAPPGVDYFKPRGIPLREIEEVEITIEEFEAIRLKNHEGLEQVEVAKKMGISQPTLNRLLKSAHKKIAQALVKGCAIKIHGGNYSLKNKR